jgi:conjugative relaxase-like TrwC/TraI family protein
MTVHKLTVGDGYTYLTRQVAGADRQRQAGQSAADYYKQAGNPPGRWVGSGVAALGLEAGGEVREDQMRNLFGTGQHPDAEAIQDAYLAAHLRPQMTRVQEQRVHAAAVRAGKLGQQFPSYVVLEPFADRVAKRLADIAAEAGRAATAAEVAGVKRQEAQRQRAGVAGYDLVFSPVKSVSLLWALHPEEQVRSQVRAAHEGAVSATLHLLEQHAAFTRSGVGGAAQIETKGLVATAFDHFDSRSGDPDLHTHVAVANKVQGVDGRWRSLDGAALYAVGVAASETYNSAIEAELTARLGVAFADRPGPARGGQPVREIEGIGPDLVRHFSARRSAIEARYAELRSDFRALHGRDPDPKVAYELAQQATLETRQGKDRPRFLADARRDWAAQATARFGPGIIDHVRSAVPVLRPAAPLRALDAAQISELAECVLRKVAEERATWTRWNVHAETMRQIRAEYVFTSPDAQRAAAAAVVRHALGPGQSITLEARSPVRAPSILCRSDGAPVFTRHQSARFTSQAVLDAENRLVAAARTPTVYSISEDTSAERIRGFEQSTGRTLDAGQRQLVTAFAADDALVAVGIGPAGSGKTTAMRALRDVLAADGRRLVGFAPSAQAAKVLEADLGIRCATVDKALWDISPGGGRSGPELAAALRWADAGQAGRPAAADSDVRTTPAHNLRPGDMLLVDEASMAGTFNLDRLTALADHVGAQVRLLGDDRQLGAVASGGILRLIAAEVGATELRDLHRFTDPVFAAASLQLRTGESAGLDYFQDRGRLRGGSADAMKEAVYAGWRADIAAGKPSLMMAHSAAAVAELSDRARADRVTAGLVDAHGIPLRNGSVAGAGDWIVTRHNDYRLKYCGGKDFVRNGQTWTVLKSHADGAMTVQSHDSHGTITLPPEYTADHVELAYATTIHRAQGMTVDTAHPLLTADLTRDALYVAATRAAAVTVLYAVTHTELPADPDHRGNKPVWDPDATAAREIAEQILAREADNRSATEETQHQKDLAASLANLVGMYRTGVEVAAEHHYNGLIERVCAPRIAEGDLADIKRNGIGALAGTLAKADATGWDPEQILTIALARKPVDDAESVAAVLCHRIEQHMGDRTPPPTGARPTPEDLDRYRGLIGAYFPDARLDTAAALAPEPVTRPHSAAHPVDPAPSALRYRAEVGEVLGAALADRVTGDPAWPAVVGTLRRAEAAGQYTHEALARAAAQRDFDGLDSPAQNLAWRIERQSRLIQLDPTHTGQAWPALAWTVKAWEEAGGDAAELIDGLAPNRTMSGLALEAGHQLTWHQRLSAAESAPHPLPWAAATRALHESNDVPPALRTFLDDTAAAISARVSDLTDQAVTERPAWTAAFGIAPADEDGAERWRAAIGLVAAHRDQQEVQTDDAAQPIGPYIETGRAGHGSWWAAAAAAIALDAPQTTPLATALADDVEAALAHTVARDLYQALPEDERHAVHGALADRLGTAWNLIGSDPEAAAIQPSTAAVLAAVLVDLGHLTPLPAAATAPTAARVHQQLQDADAVLAPASEEGHVIACGPEAFGNPPQPPTEPAPSPM